MIGIGAFSIRIDHQLNSLVRHDIHEALDNSRLQIKLIVRHVVLIHEALDNSRLQIKLIVRHVVLIHEEEYDE
jgi:hypothetical protein